MARTGGDFARDGGYSATEGGGLDQAVQRAPSARSHMQMAWLRRPALLACIVLVLALLVALPFTLTGFWVRVLTNLYMFAALAQSVNLIAGFAGYADFGNIVHFGIGAYTTGFLMKEGLPFPVALLSGAVLSATLAALLGLPILRLRGHYFAIATIGVMEGSRELVVNMGFLGGGSGLNVPIVRMPPQQFSALIYFVMLGLMVGYTGLAYVLSRSSLGYSLRAIKADEQAAAVTGINTTLAKVTAWAMSAACTAIVGGVYALWVGFIEPGVVFNVVTGTEYFMMMLLGGPGTVLGPVLGGFILQLLGITVWSQFLRGHLAILGAVIVLVVLFLPNGLVSALRGRGALRWIL
jgi:branched-chain amino acid transport system permease protein